MYLQARFVSDTDTHSTRPDQTTRIHGDVKQGSNSEEQSWHEICRPQVHGYDLIDAVFLSPTRFVSIADEKVARVFDAPRSFVSLSKHLGILSDAENENEVRYSPLTICSFVNVLMDEEACSCFCAALGLIKQGCQWR